MQSETPTDFIALKVWWAMTWRTIPLVLLGSIFLGLILGIIASLSGLDLNATQRLSMLFGALLGLYIAVKIIKRLMTNGFGDYKLVVVRK